MVNSSFVNDYVVANVKDFVQNNKSFSAWNITQAVRKNLGPNIYVGHVPTRDLVHHLMADYVKNGLYTKTDTGEYQLYEQVKKAPKVRKKFTFKLGGV